MRKVKDIFKRYRGPGANLSVAQAVNSNDISIRRSIRAKILMACVENQAECFNDLWPEFADYPDAVATWKIMAKAGLAPQALNRDELAGRVFVTYYQ